MRTTEKKHISYGVALTTKRILNLNSENSLQITDLYDNGRPAGTKVQIYLKTDESYDKDTDY